MGCTLWLVVPGDRVLHCAPGGPIACPGLERRRASPARMSRAAAAPCGHANRGEVAGADSGRPVRGRRESRELSRRRGDDRRAAAALRVRDQARDERAYRWRDCCCAAWARSSSSGSIAKGSAADARRVLRTAVERHSLVFFPEGTFTQRPGLLQVPHGAFATAARAGCPVVPAVVRGTRRALPPKGRLPRPDGSKLRSCRRCGRRRVLSRALRWSCAIARATAILQSCGEPDLTAASEPPAARRLTAARAAKRRDYMLRRYCPPTS